MASFKCYRSSEENHQSAYTESQYQTRNSNHIQERYYSPSDGQYQAGYNNAMTNGKTYGYKQNSSLYGNQTKSHHYRSGNNYQQQQAFSGVACPGKAKQKLIGYNMEKNGYMQNDMDSRAGYRNNYRSQSGSESEDEEESETDHESEEECDSYDQYNSHNHGQFNTAMAQYKNQSYGRYRNKAEAHGYGQNHGPNIQHQASQYMEWQGNTEKKMMGRKDMQKHEYRHNCTEKRAGYRNNYVSEYGSQSESESDDEEESETEYESEEECDTPDQYNARNHGQYNTAMAKYKNHSHGRYKNKAETHDYGQNYGQNIQHQASQYMARQGNTEKKMMGHKNMQNCTKKGAGYRNNNGSEYGSERVSKYDIRLQMKGL